jgi:hypothetical protein
MGHLSSFAFSVIEIAVDLSITTLVYQQAKMAALLLSSLHSSIESI